MRFLISIMLSFPLLALAANACGGEPEKKPAKTAAQMPPATAANGELADHPAAASERPKKIPECKPDPDPEVAKREFEIALEEFDRGNYPVASEGFTRAWVRSCGPKALLNLGRTYEKLADSAGALEAYQLYLERQTDGVQVDEVKKRIQALQQKNSSR